MPNILLRMERLRHGWTQRQLADFAGISLSTVERAEKGDAIRVDCIQRLCQCLSKTPEDLGLLKLKSTGSKNHTDTKQPALLYSEERDGNFSVPAYLSRDSLYPKRLANTSPLESDGSFHFGKIKTALVVLDGNGTETYSPRNIRTFYDSRQISFTEEIEGMRGKIEKEQTYNELNGNPFQWNGEIYHLAKHVLSRDPIQEQMKLTLWFHPTDYYTILAKNRCLKDNIFREKYISKDWELPLHSLPIPFGIGLSLLTADGYILFAQRGRDLGVRPGHFMTSVEEGLSRPLDRGTTSDAPDVYRCACRGLSEELGLIENKDFSVSDILFLALGMDTEYYMCGLRGFMRSQKTAHEIMKSWQMGVKDKIENKKLFAIPFTPEDVCEFVFSHGPWGGGALMGIYHTLVHEFGKEHVDTLLSSYGD